MISIILEALNLFDWGAFWIGFICCAGFGLVLYKAAISHYTNADEDLKQRANKKADEIIDKAKEK